MTLKKLLDMTLIVMAKRSTTLLFFTFAWLFHATGAFSSSLSLKPSYEPDVSPAMIAFRAWLEEQEVEGFEATEIGTKNNLRGVFSKQSFQQSEYILAVPYVSCILLSETIHDLSQSNDISDVEKGYRFWQRCSTEHHKWRPYLDCLPTRQSNFAATPDFWPDEYLAEIPSLIAETQQRRQEIQHFSQENNIPFPDLQFATWMVRSRGFSTMKLLPSANETRLRSRTLLIPYLDFLNHHPSQPNAVIEKIESKNDDESYFALVATRDIEKDEEITLCYGTGEETSLDLLSKYGFWTPNNPNDVNLLPSISRTDDLKDDDENRIAQAAGTIRSILELRAHLQKMKLRN